jgi:hypothetical protein
MFSWGGVAAGAASSTAVGSVGVGADTSGTVRRLCLRCQQRQTLLCVLQTVLLQPLGH